MTHDTEVSKNSHLINLLLNSEPMNQDYWQFFASKTDWNLILVNSTHLYLVCCLAYHISSLSRYCRSILRDRKWCFVQFPSRYPVELAGLPLGVSSYDLGAICRYEPSSWSWPEIMEPTRVQFRGSDSSQLFWLNDLFESDICVSLGHPELYLTQVQ